MYVPRDHDKRRATGKVKWPDLEPFLQIVSEIFNHRYSVIPDMRVRERFDCLTLPLLLETIEIKYVRSFSSAEVTEHMTFGQLYNQLSGR